MKPLVTICLVLAFLLAISVTAYADTGAISGTVTDSEGDPIVGLTVEAENEQEDGEWSTTTNSNGEYTLSSLPAGQYIVEACPGCTGLYYINQLYNGKTNFEEANAVTVTAGETMTDIDFELSPSGAITGTVTDSEGNPVANMTVEAENYDDDEEMDMDADTDEEGVYLITGLPPGNYRVCTDSSENELTYENVCYNDASRQDANAVPLVGTNTASGIDFVVSAGGGISGTVTDSGGEPIEGLRVEAIDYTTDDYASGDETDANGVYTLLGLSSGSYKVRACASCEDLPYVDMLYNNQTSWDKADAVTVTAPDITSSKDFTLPAGTSISGQVSGYDSGTGGYVALEGADISAENFSNGQWAGWAESDANGAYTIKGLQAGSYRVRAEHEDYSQRYYPAAVDWAGAQAVATTVADPAEDIDFELGLGGRIAGTIINQDTDEPITESVWVNACPTNGEPWGRGANQIEEDGSYVITGLPAGTYKVSANADGYDEEFYEDQTDWMMAEAVEVVIGQVTEDVDFTLKAESGGAIIGRVVLADETPVRDAWVNANSMEHMKWKGDNTDENGEFRLTGITPGLWRIQAQVPYGGDYRNYSNSQEIEVTMPLGVAELDINDITLPVVNLVGQVQMPDGTPASRAPVSIETLDWSYFSHVDTDEEGYFRKGGLSAGTYSIRLEIPWGTSGIIQPDPCIIEITDPNTVLDIGVIKYATSVKKIFGRVERNDETGVNRVEVNGWRRGTSGCAWTQTDENGDFELDVGPGTWEIMIHPSPQATDIDWVYMGGSEVVTFANDSIGQEETITFTVTSAGSQITGRVIGPNGETIRSGCAWIDIRNDSGQGNGTSVGAGGEFAISVSAGTYNIWVGIDQQTYPYWSSPRLSPLRVDESETAVLPDIELVEKNSGIEGTVTRSSDGEPVSGVSIHAWQQEGGWADASTDEDGNYRLSVLAGNWEIVAEPPYTSSYVSGLPPRRVVVPDGQIVTDVNFVLVQAGATLTLSLRDGNGAILADIDNGWAYARENEFSYEPLAGAPVSNGQASLKLPEGTYFVGVHMPPNTGYTMSGEEQIEVSGQTEADITLLGNDSTITGTFYTDANQTTPATGIRGEVFAMQNMGGMWQGTEIDPTDGTFELQVAPGSWNLGYHIRSSGYVNSPPPDSRVTVESGQTANYDFVVVAADAIVEGFVYDPDGNPVSHAWVWAHSEGDGSPGSRIDSGGEAREPDGSFSIAVPAGRDYEVGANMPESFGYVQPDMNIVTPAAGEPATVVLRFRESDATITGNVYYVDGDTNVPCPMAWVNAWSDNGQHAGAMANDDGEYTMNVTQGTTWHVEAVYHPSEEATFYHSARPKRLSMTSSTATANLRVQQASKTLPPAKSTTFDPNVGWSYTLQDGTRIDIPAGAIPSDDTVAISFSPLVDSLQRTATDKPIGWGYAISISEQSTGNKITDNFNTNVLLTFKYDAADLNEAGLTEDDIAPAYFSTTTNSWTKVESFTVDKDANTVTVQVNHFSTWALTGGAQVESEDDQGLQTVSVTITKNTIKAGKVQGQDSFQAAATFASSPPSFDGITQIDVNIISGANDVIYTESVDFDSADVKKGKFKYSNRASGAINALQIDFNKKKFTIKAKNIDLTGLTCPVQLQITMGNYLLPGVAAESVVNGSKTIPVRLMRTYDDVLNVSKAKAKSSSKPSSDSLSVKGEIAVEAIDDTDLANEEVVLTWGEQTFTIPQGSFVAKRGKSYKCSKVSVAEGGQVSGKIDLDKCKFAIVVKKASLDVTSGAVEFGLSFAAFDETDELNLP